MGAEPTQPVFYYDLSDPVSYLVAERIGMAALPVVPEWEPVLAGELGAEARALDRERLVRRAAELELLPLLWPATWPPDGRFATLAATYAKRVGRAVAFSLAAFRQEFAGGRDLGDRDTVLIAGAACEMHPTALIKGAGLRSIAQAVGAACGRARAIGVTELPAIELRGTVYVGEAGLDEVARTLEGRA
jgi:2-hydroxychromene-2-carboxylate isomerase